MRIARLYITSLIEPVYICLLTAVWVVPVVGAALTQKVCCGDQQPIIGLALVVAGAVATAALLPASYFQIHGFERRGTLYRRVGVRRLRVVAPFGTCTQAVARRLGNAPRPRSLARAGGPLIDAAQTRLNERVHVAAGLVAGCSAWHALSTGQVWEGGGLIVVGWLSGLCLCLQRYNRARLERVAGRRAAENSPWQGHDPFQESYDL